MAGRAIPCGSRDLSSILTSGAVCMEFTHSLCDHISYLEVSGLLPHPIDVPVDRLICPKNK